MTCVVGLIDRDGVYVGADSAGVSGWDLIVRADPKVFRNGEVLIGFTSSFRMGQLLRFTFEVPLHPEGISTEHYMATHFVDGVRQCLKEGGYAEKLNEREKGGAFIVAYRGELFIIESDYQVSQPADNFAAVGCGNQVAHGALHATVGMPSRNRVELALAAAERFCAGVRAPFRVEFLPRGPS